MPTGGKLIIETANADLDETYCRSHPAVQPGRYVMIAVSDTGAGMDTSTQARVFEPFFTTKAEANGLGLATVLEILQKHRGTAEVRSIVGVGTHFDIWLPCESNGDSIPLLRAPAISPRGMGQSVLIFDADRARLLRHEEIIAALGYEPIGFTDPTEVKTACLAHPDRFDAALICHRYGTSSALELAASLRETALPIILATVSAADFNAQALANAGISELIHHPLSSVEVAGALMRCVAASIERAAAC
jgi:CheY-like chemotaxis protein